jgi:outer membrane protein OmpA-like peptidoglycan-associated protein/predicted  nucleic acid-binding Zn-ribbon protein
MNERGFGVWLKGPVLPIALVGAALTVGAGELAALPLIEELAPATPLLLVEDGAGPIPEAGGADTRDDAPLAELTEALAAARAKLEQLNRAAEALAGAAALRAELAAKEEENRELLAELQTLGARRAEWQRASAAAQAEISGLGQALEAAAAEAKRLDGELAAVRWQNAQLSTSLNRVRTEQEAARAETEAVRTELSARVDELTASAEGSALETGRLNAELAEGRDELAAAHSAQEEMAARAADLQAAVDDAHSELGRMRGQLSTTAGRLNEVNGLLAAAEQERDTALGELDEERSRTDRLRGAVAAAEADLAETRAVNGDLETRLTDLEEAAMMATDAARQNLLAVETQIAALNSTLDKVDLAPPGAPSTTVPMDGEEGAVPPPSAHRPAIDEAPVPAAGPSKPGDGDLALIKLSEPTAPASPGPLDELMAELPVESRIQVQSLLADLEAESDSQSVKLIVPGGELFTVNGQEVRDTAHESLAKVAELINLYKSQPVLIIGHTDAIGAPDYNQTLSERRAGLVRQFFVDHFDVEAARLSTQGMGEQEPIASNANAAGRRANRRVEVLILN